MQKIIMALSALIIVAALTGCGNSNTPAQVGNIESDEALFVARMNAEQRERLVNALEKDCDKQPNADGDADGDCPKRRTHRAHRSGGPCSTTSALAVEQLELLSGGFFLPSEVSIVKDNLGCHDGPITARARARRDASRPSSTDGCSDCDVTDVHVRAPKGERVKVVVNGDGHVEAPKPRPEPSHPHPDPPRPEDDGCDTHVVKTDRGLKVRSKCQLSPAEREAAMSKFLAQGGDPRHKDHDGLRFVHESKDHEGHDEGHKRGGRRKRH